MVALGGAKQILQPTCEQNVTLCNSVNTALSAFVIHLTAAISQRDDEENEGDSK